jgi:hypothetical protein
MIRHAIVRNAADLRASCLHRGIRHRGVHLVGDDVGASGWGALRPARLPRGRGHDRLSRRPPHLDARPQLPRRRPNRRPRFPVRATATVAAVLGGRPSGRAHGDGDGDGGLYARLRLRLRLRHLDLVRMAFRRRRTRASLRLLRRQSSYAPLRLRRAPQPVGAARGVPAFRHVVAPRARRATIQRDSPAIRASDARRAAALVRRAARAADAVRAARAAPVGLALDEPILGGPARHAARSARAGAQAPATMAGPDRPLAPTNPRPAAAHCAASRSRDAAPGEGREARASAAQVERPPRLAPLPNGTNGWVLVGRSCPSCVR